ncbi:MAG: aldo/keto reductase [Acidimicrobiaceae bacterium]|nr:aldo/keto reductase [Acidimicrobiaceae bacterium]
MTISTTRLGRTGITVSGACLGTMTFGLQCDLPTSIAILDRAFELGVYFLDTADVYPLGGDFTTVGRTEEIIGDWIGSRREELVIATKCFGAMGPSPLNRGNSKRHIKRAVEGSLRRLRTDYIDLYQLHRFDPTVSIDETMEALDDLVREGKVLYVGASNYLAYQLALSIGRSDARDLVRFVTVQPRYNLLFREIERELLPLCDLEGIGVIPFNPIAGGMLTGKHDRSAPPPEGSRFMLGNAKTVYQERYWNNHVFDTVDELGSIARDAGLTLTQLSIAWVSNNPTITAPIIGASSPSQLDETVGATSILLDADLMTKLNETTRIYRQGDKGA